jgi:hypothetical protein
MRTGRAIESCGGGPGAARAPIRDLARSLGAEGGVDGGGG